ncbi:MAG: glycosyltransferase [bacterium]|jgi:glycosyltransferase involved in cell wall biosynthesis
MSTIIYIGGELPDNDASALRVMANAKALREYGYNVVLIGQTRKKQHSSTTFTEIEGFRVYFVSYPRSTTEWIREIFSSKIYKRIISEYNDVSAIVCYNFHANPLLSLIRYGKRNSIAVIADCTEWHTVNHLSLFKRATKYYDITKRIRHAQYKCDGIIAISNYFKDMYQDKLAVVVIPPLVDREAAKWNSDPKSFKESRVKRFVYAGRMGIGKDYIRPCLVSFSKFKEKNYKIDIVGVTKDEYLNKNPDHTSLLEKLGRKVCFYGMLPHEETLEFVNKADFSLLIRKHNRKNDSGFPTKLAESITCGTPVIATDFSDVRQYIEKYQLGIMIDTVDNIYSGLERALSMNNDELEKLKQNCLNCRAFDYRNYIDILGNFIEEICTESRRAR